MKPTIGIIGGSGPLATLDIEKKILISNQKLLQPLLDQDYYNLIVLNHADISDRNDSMIFGRMNPLSQYVQHIDSMTKLKVDLILLACNTTHLYLPVLQKRTNIPIISIIEVTTRYLREKFQPSTSVGLIATQATKEKKLYHDALSAHDLQTIDVNTEIQHSLMQAIYLIKSGIELGHKADIIRNPRFNRQKDSTQIQLLQNHPFKRVLLQEFIPNPIYLVSKAIQELSEKGCQAVIFGCTELPLVMPYLEQRSEIELIDPNLIVAEAIVEKLHRLENQTQPTLEIVKNEKRYV